MKEDNFLYEEEPLPPFRHELFECAPALRIEAHERVAKLQFESQSKRMERIESQIERLERRLWLTVYGIVATVLAQAITSLLPNLP